MHGSCNRCRHRGGGALTHYTVCCGYASHFHNTVTVEADTLDEALEKVPSSKLATIPIGNLPTIAAQHLSMPLPRVRFADLWGDTSDDHSGPFPAQNGEPPVVILTRYPPARQDRGRGRHGPHPLRGKRSRERRRNHRTQRPAAPSGQYAAGGDRARPRRGSSCHRCWRQGARAPRRLGRNRRTSARQLISGAAGIVLLLTPDPTASTSPSTRACSRPAGPGRPNAPAPSPRNPSHNRCRPQGGRAAASRQAGRSGAGVTAPRRSGPAVHASLSSEPAHARRPSGAGRPRARRLRPHAHYRTPQRPATRAPFQARRAIGRRPYPAAGPGGRPRARCT